MFSISDVSWMREKAFDLHSAKVALLSSIAVALHFTENVSNWEERGKTAEDALRFTNIIAEKIGELPEGRRGAIERKVESFVYSLEDVLKSGGTHTKASDCTSAFILGLVLTGEKKVNREEMSEEDWVVEDIISAVVGYSRSLERLYGCESLT